MKNLNVALVQFDIVWEDTMANLTYLQNAFETLKPDTDLVLLPEMFHCGFSMSPSQNAQKKGGIVLEWLKAMAVKHQTCLMGSVVVEIEDSYYNRLYVVDKHKIEWYDKRHLFTMGGEKDHYSRGEHKLIVDVNQWKICPLICYDLRFPVWSRNTNDYEVLIYVANWPSPRREVWKTLLKARAIENQSYVVGVNRIGRDINTNFSGDSQVIDARGGVILDLQSNNEIAYVTLLRSELDTFRKKFPVLNDMDDFVLNSQSG